MFSVSPPQFGNISRAYTYSPEMYTKPLLGTMYEDQDWMLQTTGTVNVKGKVIYPYVQVMGMVIYPMCTVYNVCVCYNLGGGVRYRPGVTKRVRGAFT